MTGLIARRQETRAGGAQALCAYFRNTGAADFNPTARQGRKALKSVIADAQ